MNKLNRWSRVDVALENEKNVLNRKAVWPWW
jgi:hypothetical protein